MKTLVTNIQQLDKTESFIKVFSVCRRKIDIGRPTNIAFIFFQDFIIKLFVRGAMVCHVPEASLDNFFPFFFFLDNFLNVSNLIKNKSYYQMKLLRDPIEDGENKILIIMVKLAL